MSRKPSAPKSKKREKIPPAIHQSKIPVDPDNTDFDFGGLPKRDLKKNLGCG